jgi:hypothetical protein
VAIGPESGDVVAVDRDEVAALCLAALDAAGASGRVAELLRRVYNPAVRAGAW